MSISYIFGKKELTILAAAAVGRTDFLPEGFADDVQQREQTDILEGLKRKGYVSFSDRRSGRISVEQTAAFFMNMIAEADYSAVSDDGGIYAFYCPKLVIILGKDRLSAEKCRITPLRDENDLRIYSEENDIIFGDKKKLHERNEEK